MSEQMPPCPKRVADAALEATVIGSFSKAGPFVRSRLFGWTDPSPGALAGRVGVVTGATSGIGESVASGLAALGATVHLVGRDPDKLAAALDRIRLVVPDASIVGHEADLSRLDDVRSLGERLLGDLDRIDVLAHVAGALVHDLDRTDDGIEVTFQVHVVAPHLLTSTLLPALERSGGRVITMASGGMYTQRLDVDALVEPPEPFDGTRAYARAKRAQVEMNTEWARRHGSGSVAFHAMHPGWVDTPGLTAGLPTFARLLRPVLRNPDLGADTAVWLAQAPEAGPPSSGFWLDRRQRRTVVLPWTKPSPPEVTRLWNTVESLSRKARA